ncbi:hypothetical protein B0H10DRAFT_2204548 [Mycena sp. CBHHK59/15]|nr:hypothetical protein B0H10DRAFT_2204548 [Mycena sp. CBHHK59/15]
MASIRDRFPPEILAKIFGFTTYRTLIQVPLVCHRWREVALDFAGLWVNISIHSHDIGYATIICDVLARSRQRTFFLEIKFEPPISRDSVQLRNMLETAVMPHLSRCFGLHIRAQRGDWMVIIPILQAVELSQLRALSAENFADSPPPPTSTRVTQSSPALTLPPVPILPPAPTLVPIADRPAPPLPDLILTMPPEVPLRHLRLRGLSPDGMHNLDSLHIENQSSRMLSPDGRISRWLLDSPALLKLEDMCIPIMSGGNQSNAQAAHASPVRHLVLSRLRPTMRIRPAADGARGHDCTPFFAALQTPNVRSLELDRFPHRSRVFGDFLRSLPESQEKYLQVAELTLRGLRFPTISSVFLSFVLGSFPTLEHLKLFGCYPGTWEMVMGVLEMDPKLCPKVKGVHLDDDETILPRDDPLPFRVTVFGG